MTMPDYRIYLKHFFSSAPVQPIPVHISSPFLPIIHLQRLPDLYLLQVHPVYPLVFQPMTKMTQSPPVSPPHTERSVKQPMRLPAHPKSSSCFPTLLYSRNPSLINPLLPPTLVFIYYWTAGTSNSAHYAQISDSIHTANIAVFDCTVHTVTVKVPHPAVADFEMSIAGVESIQTETATIHVLAATDIGFPVTKLTVVQ